MNNPATRSFDTDTQPSRTEIEAWLMRRLAQELEENEANLDPTARFASYGLDSMSALVLTGELEEWLELELPSTLVWDFPTARDLAIHLDERLREAARVAA
jgi:acyl carrier protein